VVVVELLPCLYYHVTVTIPEPLCALFHANQYAAYDLLMLTTAKAVLEHRRPLRR
jgi:hypothetical protein